MNRTILQEEKREKRNITSRVFSNIRDLSRDNELYAQPLYRETARFMASERVCPTFYLMGQLPISDLQHTTPLFQKLSLCSYETTGRCFRKLNEQQKREKMTKAEADDIIDSLYIDGGPFFIVLSNDKWPRRDNKGVQ